VHQARGRRKANWIAKVLLGVLAGLLASCTGGESVNAAFRGTRVEWFLFQPTSPTGLLPLESLQQPREVTWVVRPQSVHATASLPWPDEQGVLSVSHEGLLVLSDRDGPFTAFRPGANWPLERYRTGQLFRWSDKVFVTLARDLSSQDPPLALAWWQNLQPRVVLLPVPSQLKFPDQQLVSAVSARPGVLTLSWWSPSKGDSWTEFSLTTGEEVGSEARVDPEGETGDRETLARHQALQKRWGVSIPILESHGGPHAISLTAQGSLAVQASLRGPVRLFRLPDLGPSGRYTQALGLRHHLVLTWEISDRAYVGGAGLLSVPWTALVH